MRWHHGLRSCWPVRRFVVVEHSMLPALQPGDGLLAVRCGVAKPGQVRVFPDPRGSSMYLVKRVGDVRETAAGAMFEARSDNSSAPGVTDSRRFGPVPVAGSYRVVLAVRGSRVVLVGPGGFRRG
ncbi:S26 family signal peptidase [Mycobacterium sp. SMC-4]|uniref:S26 family signal peptidase n=1 Tax=Mycobacterium sp. SMC-4 TaxID=2857059 RepID=UPI003CFF6EBE